MLRDPKHLMTITDEVSQCIYGRIDVLTHRIVGTPQIYITPVIVCTLLIFFVLHSPIDGLAFLYLSFRFILKITYQYLRNLNNCERETVRLHFNT